MRFNISYLGQLSQRGRGCRIAIFDEAKTGQIRVVDNAIAAGEHVRRITGFLNQPELQGFADQSEIYSVSFHDCLRHGYHAVKAQLVAEHGFIHIEAHAYSFPANATTNEYERQIAATMRDPAMRSLFLCSPGHDGYRVRFPATSKYALAVGSLRADGSILGAGLGALLPPTFLLEDSGFPALDDNGNLTSVSGTSPGVTFVAGLSALLFEQLFPVTNDGAPIDFEPAQLHAALLLLSEPYQQSYLLQHFSVLQQTINSCTLSSKKGRQRNLTLRMTRTDAPACRIGLVVRPMNAPALGQGQEFPVQIKAQFADRNVEVQSSQVMWPLDEFTAGSEITLSINIDGLTDGLSLAWCGAQLEIISEDIKPIKAPGEIAIVGVSASHDASAVLVIGEKLVAGVQLERVTRIKHDGQSALSHDQAIEYCLAVGGLKLEDIDTFAFNIQALTPGYIGLSQPVAQPGFSSFDPFGLKALFVSHHLCHALAGYSGSHFKQATVVVADGSGGVTLGADDLVLAGADLQDYVRRDRGSADLRLHTFSVYEFNTEGYSLKHREYASSFNVRSGSASLGEAYAAVSQFVFGSWQTSGKLMGLAPYGKAQLEGTYLQRDPQGALNFSAFWKMDAGLYRTGKDVLRYADLAARIQLDLETAVIDRFQQYVGDGKDVVFSGGIALNSVANFRIRNDIKPTGLYLLPAQHDAGVAIGAASAAIFKATGRIPSDLFAHDFLGYRYSKRDVALAINQFSDRLQVSHITPQQIATRIAEEEVFGFFSLKKGSEFGPRALGARSILADPRKRSVWTFINKWIKYREEFRPFAPMVAEEALSDFFEAHGCFPYMLEVVQVRKGCRDQLAGITHVDGSARVQTIAKKDDPEIYALLRAFERVSGVPILLNTSFNVRGQPMVERPLDAIEMLLSTQLNGVIFDDLLVEVREYVDVLGLNGKVVLSPGTRLQLECDENGVRGLLQVQNQGKKIKLQHHVCAVLQALAEGCTVGQALMRSNPSEHEDVLTNLHRYCRLRFLNRLTAKDVT